MISACEECVISYAPRVFVPSGTVLLALHRCLRVGLLDIDVADHLRHAARQTSLNQPQAENRDHGPITGKTQSYYQQKRHPAPRDICGTQTGKIVIWIFDLKEKPLLGVSNPN